MRVFIWIYTLIITSVICLESPEQVHLSYGDSPDQMVVMWSTGDDVTSAVYYGISHDELTERLEGEIHEAKWSAKRYLHRAVLKDLQLGTRYYYKVLSNDSAGMRATQVFSFKTTDSNPTGPLSFLVYGDMGVHAWDTFTRISQEVTSGQHEAIWHVGDFAYDLHSQGGMVGDEFMRRIENISANIPYMTSPGNHEIKWEQDFYDYRMRFNAPGRPWPAPENRLWYSYNVGPIHFISYSTEVYFTHNQANVCEQFYWLLEDLIKANNNRASQPWIVAMGHRPMYCSNSNIDDCTERVLSGWVRHGLEDLFLAQGVDFVIEAHEHSYERLYPMYKGQVMSTDYVNLTVPVHVISGAAGSIEENDWISSNAKSWSAYRHSVKGDHTYGRLVVHNSTHLYWDQVRVTNGDVIDSIWLVQHAHGPFVKGVNCSVSESERHPSCKCPPLFRFVTVLICVLVPLIILVGIAVFICIRRCNRRKRMITYRKLTVNSRQEDEEMI